MSRLAGLLFLLLLVLLLFPPVRRELRPYAQPAIDPLYEWSARNRVKSMVNSLREEEILGRKLPTPREFSSFLLQRAMQEDGDKDPWGNPYYLRVLRRGYYVGSPGRDGLANTGDDIVSETVTRRAGPGGRPGAR